MDGILDSLCMYFQVLCKAPSFVGLYIVMYNH